MPDQGKELSSAGRRRNGSRASFAELFLDLLERLGSGRALGGEAFLMRVKRETRKPTVTAFRTFDYLRCCVRVLLGLRKHNEISPVAAHLETRL